MSSTLHWASLLTRSLWLSLLVAPPVAAHGLDANLLTVQLTGKLVRLEVTPTVDALAFVDDDHNGQLTKAEVDAHRPGLRALYLERVHLQNDQRQVPALSFFDVVIPGGAQNAPDGKDHLSFRAQHDFDAPAQALVVDYALFAPGGEGLVRATAGRKPSLQADMERVERAAFTPQNTRAVFFFDGDLAPIGEALMAEAHAAPGASGTEGTSLRQGLGLLLLAIALVLAGLLLVRHGKRQQRAERDRANASPG